MTAPRKYSKEQIEYRNSLFKKNRKGRNLVIKDTKTAKVPETIAELHPEPKMPDIPSI